MSIFQHRKNETIIKKKLEDVNPGITVQIDDPNGRFNYYKVCKLGNTQMKINDGMANNGERIPVMNLATGRLVYKWKGTEVESVKEEIYISDPSEYLGEINGNL